MFAETEVRLALLHTSSYFHSPNNSNLHFRYDLGIDTLILALPANTNHAMDIAQDTSHGRYVPPGNPRRHSEAVTEMIHQSTSARSQSRMMKGYRRRQADIPRHYQTAPSSSSYGAPAFNRSNSSGSAKRPLSFIATFASKVKNAIEGWQVNGM